MPILTQKAVLLAKVETTTGVDASPAAATDAILVSEPQFSVQAEEVTRDFVRNDFSQYPSRYIRRRGQISFKVEVAGGGVVDLAPNWANLLEGCGFAKSTVSTGDPIDGIKYTPISDNLKTLTLYLYFDGILHKMLGAMGSWSLTGQAGGIATIEFTFEGTYVTPSNTSMPAAPVYADVIPPIVEFAGLKWNGSSANLITGDVSIDWQNTIAQRPDVNSAQGLYALYISGRNPTAGFTPEVATALNSAFWPDWEGSTTRELAFHVGGTGPLPGSSLGANEGNSVIFTAPAVQITNIGYGDRDSIKTYDLGVALRRGPAGNDELTILFS